MTDTLKYPKGSVIQFTAGEYDDFGLAGPVVTIADCDLPALVQQYVAQEKRASPASGFAAWLIANGHAMPVDCAEVHLTAYTDHSDWAPEFGVERKP